MNATHYYNMHMQLEIHTQGRTQSHQKLLGMVEGIK